MISIPYPRLNCLKTMPFTVANSSIAYIREYAPTLPQWIFKYVLLSCSCLDVVEKMKRRRSVKTSDAEEAMDTTEDNSPVTLSADR